MLRTGVDHVVVYDVFNFLGMGSINMWHYLLLLEPLLAVATLDAFKVGAI